MNLKNLRQTLFKDWQGCSNHGCIVRKSKAGSIGTNAICQCVANASRGQLSMLDGRLRMALQELEKSDE